MNKLLIRERAEQIHKLFNSGLMELDKAVIELRNSGFEYLFNKESERISKELGIKSQKFNGAKYLRSKVIYLK